MQRVEHSLKKTYRLFWIGLIFSFLCIPLFLACGPSEGQEQVTGEQQGHTEKSHVDASSPSEKDGVSEQTATSEQGSTIDHSNTDEKSNPERGSDASAPIDFSGVELGPECGDKKPCEGGLVCRDGKCVACEKNGDCGGSRVCDKGICIAPECSSTKPCSDGRLCQDAKCVDCQGDTECSQGKVCEEGSCVDAECGNGKKCLNGKVCTKSRCKDCTSDASCGTGRICEGTRCLSGCRSDKDCTSGTRCQLSSKKCVACLSTKDCKDGKFCSQSKCIPCRRDGDCGAGKLCEQGRCVVGNCRKASDCSKKGQLCKNRQCRACQKDGECGAGWICEQSLCKAGCRSKSDCQNNQVCESRTKTCVGCNSAKDCKAGQVCKNKRCGSCINDSDCASGSLCLGGRCEVGNCRSDKDCKGGQVCLSRKCSACTSDTQCASGQLCLAGFCKVANCRGDKDCNSGTLCKNNVCGSCKVDKDCIAQPLYRSSTQKQKTTQGQRSSTFTFDKLPFPHRAITVELFVQGNYKPFPLFPISVKVDGKYYAKIVPKSAGKERFQIDVLADAGYDGKITVELQYFLHSPLTEFSVSLTYLPGGLCLNGTCQPGNCRKSSDCSTRTCHNVGSACEDLSYQCSRNRCVTNTTYRGSGRCSSLNKKCVVYLGLCKESQNGASIVSTAYNKNSDKQKYLPSGFKYIKSFYDSKTDGHAYYATSKHYGLTVCHYGIRGLPKVNSLNALRQQIQLISNLTPVSCYTTKKQKIGSCATGVYNRYLGLRKAGLLSHILSNVKGGHCKGGLRLDGHSMGGALVSLMAAELYMTDPKVYNKDYMRVYSYGQLRQFTSSAADKFHKVINKLRWVNELDYAPKYPGGVFRHYGDTRFIKKVSGGYSFTPKSQNYEPSWSITDGFSAHNSLRYLDRLKHCK